MKRKASAQIRKLLEKGRATDEQLFNELADFMIEKKSNKQSITRGEVMRFFDCSGNKATRILKTFVLSAKLTKDTELDNLFWLVLE